jgi:hypothetical protein
LEQGKFFTAGVSNEMRTSDVFPLLPIIAWLNRGVRGGKPSSNLADQNFSLYLTYSTRIHLYSHFVGKPNDEEILEDSQTRASGAVLS